MEPSLNERRHRSLLGAFAADALAMPVHWYYDRRALARDYGRIDRMMAPRNNHPDSILWRSHYDPPNPKGDILHGQAVWWGQRGVHYHQFLEAGENTLNLQLALLLLTSLRTTDRYDARDYLDRYIDFMTTPGRHRDTYVEECHRNFFLNYARGRKPADCGTGDIHIGGLAHVPVLTAWFAHDQEAALAAVSYHVRLTHRGEEVETAARDFARMLLAVLAGADLRESIERFGNNWVGGRRLQEWSRRTDEEVIGPILSPACYLRDAFPAALFLAWKHAGNIETALISNTNLGGDNCHRGVVTGALLGATGGGLPDAWLTNLKATQSLENVFA
jgi:ADP-ribosylglycohydrolase